MKPIIITLMYLNIGGDIKLDSFEIFTNCSSWFNTHIAVVEKKKKTLWSNRSYHVYKDKKVVGYVCQGKEPQ